MISNPQKILESKKRSQLGFPDVQLQNQTQPEMFVIIKKLLTIKK